MHRPCVRHPWYTLLITLAVLAVAWAIAGPPTFNSSAWVMLQSDQRNLTTYNELRETLSGLEIVGVVIDPIDVFSDAGARRIDAVTTALARVPGVEGVTSLTTSDRPVREGLSIGLRRFIPVPGAEQTTTHDWDAIRHRVVSHLIARNVLVAEDGGAAMVLAICNLPMDTEAQRAALRADLIDAMRPFENTTLIAYSVVDGEVRATVKADAARFIPAAGLLMIGILLITFRDVRLVAAMLVNHALVILALPPLLKGYAVLSSVIMGYEVASGFDLYTNMLLPLTAAIHLALQVHVVSACLNVDADDASVRIDQGVQRVLRPTIIAAVTTVIGLGSLAFAEVGPVARFAIVGGLAVALAAAYTLGPGLALIQWTLPPARPKANVTWAVEPTAAKHRWAAPVALVLLALLPGVAMIRTDVRAIEFLNHQSPTRLAAELIDSRFGGINIFIIAFEVGTDFQTNEPVPINDLRLLRHLHEKRQRLASLPGVGGAYDYSQTFSMINRVWNGDKPEFDRLPDSVLGHALIARLLEATPLPFIEKLRNEAGDAAYILIRTASMPSRDYLALLESVMEVASADPPPGVTVVPRTGLHTVLKQDRRLVYDQTVSTGITLGLVFLMTLVVWRSPALAAALTAVSAMPVLAMLGLAGYTDISINSITMMTASIVLGLSVDDSAHLIDTALRRRREGLAWRDAVWHATSLKRRPIICTTAILGSMLGLFALSSFPPVRHFGLLACAALLASLAAVLLVLPWLLRHARR